jgi:hypothetical protein
MIAGALSNAIRGIGGEPELNRVIGAFGGVSYIIGAHVFVAWELALGRSFDLTTYCLAFPGGLGVVVGSIAGAVAIKDRSVAVAKQTEAATSATNANTADQVAAAEVLANG